MGDFFKSLSRYLTVVLVLSGCASQTASPVPLGQDVVRINQDQAATIKSLDKEIRRLNLEIERLSRTGQSDLSQSKADLESGLGQAVESGDLTVSMEEKGLVVTVLDRVLFDPGKAQLKDSAIEPLLTVAQVLNGEVKSHFVYIEGHTDNQPIRRSGWRSNWELSTARANEVLHFFIDRGQVSARRLAATGYAEFHPVVSNDLPEGRMKNRRVEIVVSPKELED